MRLVVCVLWLCLICILGLSVYGFCAEMSERRTAEELLIDRKYPEAITILEHLLDRETEDRDELLFLRGNASYGNKDYKTALDCYQRLLQEFPDSDWKEKAAFKQAECYLRLQHFKEAEEIYEQRIARLVSPERKERIASIYLQFAEEYFSGERVNRSGEEEGDAQPNYERARTFYELALQMGMSDTRQHEVRFQVARCAFELEQYSEAISLLKALKNEVTETASLTDIIYYLGQAYLKQGQVLQARRVFRDFIEEYPDDPKAPEIAFFISRTFNIPDPQSVEDLELGVKALQEFCDIYPDDKRSPRADYEIGLSFYHYGRYDDAIAAFSAYLAKYEAKTPAAQVQEDDTFDGLPLARYYLGVVYREQRKFQQAIEVWNTYLQKHPSHNYWSEVQRQIIEAEYLIADGSAREEQDEIAQRAFQQFLSEHPLEERNPGIMVRIGDLFVNRADREPPESEAQHVLLQEALSQWKRTVSKYPDTEAASQAQFQIGQLLESRLSEFEKAIEAYQQVTWGSYAARAQERMREMRAKRLTVLTERVFRTNKPCQIKVTTRNIETLTLKMYKVDLETYFRKMHTTEGVDDLDIALIDPDAAWTESIAAYKEFREVESLFTMPFSEPGAYLVTCSEDLVADEVGYEATTFVIISDLDAIVKTTKRDALIFAQNMRTGAVYPGAKVLVSDGEKIFFEGRTQEDGVVHEALDELKEAQDLRIFVYDGTHYAASALDVSGLRYVAGLESRGYIYTDRPAYRPGQQVHGRGILREVDAQGILRVPGLTTPAARETTVSVLNSQGTPLYEETVALNEFGTFSVDLTLTETAPTGEYRILAHRGKETYTGSFFVEQYTLEKVKLSIETNRDIYFRGETLTGHIKAEYYYGEPIKGKQIRYALADLEPLSGITDENGEVEFSLSTRDFAESQPLAITARIDDEHVQTGKTVWLATRGFSCQLETLRSVYLVGEEIEVNLLTRDPAGQSIEKALTFGVFKRETTSYDEKIEVKVEEQQVATGKDGSGSLIVRLKEGGEYVLRAEGRDRFGNPVSGQTEVFISGEDDDMTLRLIANTEELAVGTSPEITLVSRASAGLGLLTCEGEAILSYQIVSLQQERTPLNLAIQSEHAPNFTLAVTQMDGNKLHQAQKEFSVIERLTIALDVEKSAASGTSAFFKPGEEVRLKITTFDQNGVPVPAEVSLAMVDEALFAQYAESVPPISEFFSDQRRGLLAKTDSSCTFRFSADTREIVKDILEEDARVAEEMREFEAADEMAAAGAELPYNIVLPSSKTRMRAMKSGGMPMTQAAAPAPEPTDGDKAEGFLTALREYFPETAYWNPQIVTGADGTAVVKIPLPDSTTQWRMTCRGITKDTLVGEATTGIVTKMPFFAEMKLPPVFTEGDNATVLASLHNYSGADQTVRMTFAANLDSRVIAHQEQTVSAEERSVVETEYALDLSDVPSLSRESKLSLRVAATADYLQDRLSRDVSVRPWGIEYIATKSGTLQGDRKISIALPEKRPYTHRELNILLNLQLDRTLLELTDDRPWSFSVPQSSAIHEAALVLNALQFLESGQSPENSHEVSLRTLRGRLTSLLTAIRLQQNRDGGWNWAGQEEQSHLFVSADAVALLARARQQGYAVPAEVLKKGVMYLKRAFQSAQGHDVKTSLLYALTVAGEVDFAHVNRVYRERNALHTVSLAKLSVIYHNLKRPEIAGELLTLLRNRARISRDPATGTPTVFWPSDSPFAWWQDESETTAVALLALQTIEPTSDLIPGGIAWLFTQRRWVGWGSMRANARVSSALLEYFARARYAANHYTVRVSVNGQFLRKLDVTKEQGALTLRVPADLLSESDNSIAFDLEGRGTLNYVCALSGISKDLKATRAQYEIIRSYEPAPLTFHGKELPRGFSVLDGSYSPWRNTVTQIPLGGFGRVSVRFQRRAYEKRQRYQNRPLVIEEPIPAGCTVLEQSIQGRFLQYELRDGKIVFYLKNARYGTVSYDLYGYIPGTYKILPTKIHAPYSPELVDYGAPSTLSVLKRGEAVTEQYRKTPDELYFYGKALFDEQQYAEARPLLFALFDEYRLKTAPYRDTARMLLSIAIAEENARDIVQYFEILKEKYPDLVLSFADILRVGRAYRDLQEYERAVQVLKATAEASFLKDVQVSGTLEAQGKFLPSVSYTRKLWAEYPDMPITETSFYALAQLLSTEAEGLRQPASPARQTSLSRADLLRQTIDMFRQFLTLYPENPLVDEVSFSLANAYLDLEEFESVIQAVKRFQERYPQSQYLSGYHYIEGYANFERERYEESLTLCRRVATQKYPNKQGKLVDSDHKELALYMMGQIYHSMGQPDLAIAEYEKVKERFPDASETIAYFTRKKLRLDEVTTFTSRRQDEARSTYQVPLHYRNINKVELLVYRVDLMKLYLLQKNLNNITDINLAGITPYYQETLLLPENADYTDQEHLLTLPLETEGAYLVVAKASELDTSGMALVSPLTMDVEEEAASGRVRVNVMNAETGRYENKVHVKVIGTGDSRFVSGSTDLRGIFIADNIHGTATVIARKGDQYAFYRGTVPLQRSDSLRQRPALQAPADLRSQAVQQLRETNLVIQQQSEGYLRRNLYQNTQKGVEVQRAY